MESHKDADHRLHWALSKYEQPTRRLEIFRVENTFPLKVTFLLTVFVHGNHRGLLKDQQNEDILPSANRIIFPLPLHFLLAPRLLRPARLHRTSGPGNGMQYLSSDPDDQCTNVLYTIVTFHVRYKPRAPSTNATSRALEVSKIASHAVFGANATGLPFQLYDKSAHGRTCVCNTSGLYGNNEVDRNFVPFRR